MELYLKGKSVLVTGGSSGIGESIVSAYLAEGAHVTFVGRDAKKGKDLESQYNQQGYKSSFVVADLNQDSACKAAVDHAVNTFGGIDILVNNAGVNDKVSLDMGTDLFVASLHKNLVHYFAMAHYSLPYLKASEGNIINIGSKVANTGQGETSGYAASKGGVQALTREWAAGLRNYNIRVNEVIPAEVFTPLYAQLMADLPDGEAEKARIEAHIPLGQRFTTGAEIAAMVLFISSNVSSHTTAQLLYVDGGYTHLDRMLT